MLDQIDHLVVLMLENRSFDNVFGYFKPASGAPVDGLTGRESNTGADGTVWQVKSNLGAERGTWMPDPDPGELWTDINQQIFGNTDAQGMATMGGFAVNYASAPQNGSAQNIMRAFDPTQLPALVSLADRFALCDRWFASAPCQTWPNRFFVHCATAGGVENNAPDKLPFKMKTVFNQLMDDVDTPQDWRIYFHDFPQTLTLDSLWPHLDHFKPFDDFLHDAANGALPAYSFLEPRYFADLDWPNDMHPPHNVAYGDQLVASVYNALRQSSCWKKTLLVIIFDEHGGCYDHVVPPPAPAPQPPAEGQAFAFDRFGIRVPAVVVSPWIAPGTVFRAPDGAQAFDHTSVIRTLRDRFGIRQSLTQRDLNAPSLAMVLTLPGATNDGPDQIQGAVSPAEDDAQALDKARLAPLNGFQKALHDSAVKFAPMVQVNNGTVSLVPVAQAAGSSSDSGITGALDAVIACVEDAVVIVKGFISKLFGN